MKQILTYFFTVFALLTATLPAAYADNKKTAKKETVKKDAAKKDNAKKEPADKKKDDKKKDGAKSENTKKDNAKGGKKQEKEKNTGFYSLVIGASGNKNTIACFNHNWLYDTNDTRASRHLVEQLHELKTRK